MRHTRRFAFVAAGLCLVLLTLGANRAIAQPPTGAAQPRSWLEEESATLRRENINRVRVRRDDPNLVTTTAIIMGVAGILMTLLVVALLTTDSEPAPPAPASHAPTDYCLIACE